MIKQIVILTACVVTMLFTLSGCYAKPGDHTVNEAIAAYRSQDYNKALMLFNQVLDEDTNYSPELIYTFIANVYMAQEDIDNAIIYQEKTLAIKEDYRGYVTLGLNYHAAGNDEKAELNYRRAISLNGDQAEAYASLGALYIGQKKAEMAVENLEKAQSINGNLSVVPANLAVAYAMSGRFEDSDKAIDRARELKCNNIEQYQTLIEEYK